MTGFNKFPVGGVTEGNEGIYSNFNVKLPRSSLGPGEFADMHLGNTGEGFAGNGDWVELPISAGTSIEYFNAAGASQWTVAVTDINAAADFWVGFTFDSGDSLIYVVAVDTGTAPDTYYTASVNSAGTVTAIGNDQPSADFTTTITAGFNGFPVTLGVTMIQRVADGSGSLLVRQTNTAGFEEMELNIATGAVVSDPAAVVASTSFAAVAWRTQRGSYANPGARALLSAQGVPVITALVDQVNAGWPATNAFHYVQWKGSVIQVSGTSAALLQSRFILTIAEFDQWVDDVLTTQGLEL